MKSISSFALLIICFLGCQQPPTAQSVLDQTIEAHGGEKVFNSLLAFDFRKKHYISSNNHGHYSMERIFSDSTGNIHDVLNNEGFTRTINDSTVTLDEEWTGKYSRSVNSVIYFSRIPFVLKDPAVKLKLLPDAAINGNDYHKLEVTFNQAGGGDDYSDTFIYWINKSTNLVDYLAYSYHTDGGGKRFRGYKNRRDVDGFITQDYINYEPKDLSVPLEDYDFSYEEDGMKVLSQIENEHVTITYLQ